jgi:hypothetical protein
MTWIKLEYTGKHKLVTKSWQLQTSPHVAIVLLYRSVILLLYFSRARTRTHARTHIETSILEWILCWVSFFFYLFFFFLFTHYLYGPGQTPITTMLNFNRFFVSTTLYFPCIFTSFSSPDYENVPNTTFCSSILRMPYLRQWASFPVSSHKWFTRKILAINWLMHS